MRIYLVRHGETQWNVEGRIQGWKNSKLTEKGIKDALALGRYLKEVNFKCVYTSPFERAYDTAKYIVGHRQCKILVNDNFRELNFGQWEGQDFNTVRSNYPDEEYNLWNAPASYISVGGENIDEFLKRVKAGLLEIINNNHQGNILLVTHALVIKAIYNIIRQLPLEDIWNAPKIGNTSLTILEVDKGLNNVKILQEANTEYLNVE